MVRAGGFDWALSILSRGRRRHWSEKELSFFGLLDLPCFTFRSIGGGRLNMSQENSNTLQPAFTAGEVLYGLS